MPNLASEINASVELNAAKATGAGQENNSDDGAYNSSDNEQ